MGDARTKAEVADDQRHFDLAVKLREQQRAWLERPVSAGDSKANSAIQQSNRDRLERMPSSGSPPADCSVLLEGGEEYFVGKWRILDEEKDEVVYPWQDGRVKDYFEATPQDSKGVARKRDYSCQGTKIQDFTDTIFADLKERIGQLGISEPHFDDTLLKGIEQSRGERMQEIVKTIHASQFPIVRAPMDIPLLVQGGPGTGKTVVALHRVSWLLYNEHERLTGSDVLVLGPTTLFMDFISEVLPSLGDGDVVQMHVAGLPAMGDPSRMDAPRVARLKGDGRMKGLLSRAVRNLIAIRAKADGSGQLSVGRSRLDSEEIGNILEELTENIPTLPYQLLRLQFKDRVQQLLQRHRVSTSTSGVDAIVNSFWPNTSPQALIQQLLGSKDRLLAAAGADFTGEEIESLHRPSSQRLSEEKWSRADLFLIDEAKFLLSGTDEFKNYGHVVVDEAQDLTPMEIRAIRRRMRADSITLVGDLAQSTGVWPRETWAEVIDDLQLSTQVDLRELQYGYRVPQSAYELAAKLLPMAAPDVTPPIMVRQGEDPIVEELSDNEATIEAAVEKALRYSTQGQYVGVIGTPWDVEAIQDALERKQSQKGMAPSDGAGRIRVVKDEDCKGLEFDVVVLVDPFGIMDAEGQSGAKAAAVGMRRLYVATTRTTQRLHVVHESGRIPPAWTQDVSEGDPSQGTSEIASGTRPSSAISESTPSGTEGSTHPTEGSDWIDLLIDTNAQAIAMAIQKSLAREVWLAVGRRVLERLEAEQETEGQPPDRSAPMHIRLSGRIDSTSEERMTMESNYRGRTDGHH